MVEPRAAGFRDGGGGTPAGPATIVEELARVGCGVERFDQTRQVLSRQVVDRNDGCRVAVAELCQSGLGGAAADAVAFDEE